MKQITQQVTSNSINLTDETILSNTDELDFVLRMYES